MTDSKKPDKSIDCSGLCCSLPLVEARYKLDKMKNGETLEIIATCPSSQKDMDILTSLNQFELVRSWKEQNEFHFIVKKVH
jgi:tRNA 2-thiouridine synthesizing protein A